MSTVEPFLGGQRHAVITDDDHGPVLQIAMWFLMVAMIVMTGLRLAIRYAAARDLGLDDAVCVVAMFMAIGSTIALSLAVNNGLGEKDSVRNDSLTLALEKNMISASILYIFSIYFAKVSTLVLMTRLLPNRHHLVVVRGVMVFVSLWAISAVFADAFSCSLPRTFDFLGGRCFDIKSFWDAISALDIFSDLVIVGLAFWLFAGLQMRLGPKLIVLSTFAGRIFVVAATASRIVYLNRLHTSSDIFFTSIPFFICTQAQQAVSVIVASAPGLKQFMDRTNSGMLNVSLGGHTGTTYGGTHQTDNYVLSNMSNRSWTSGRFRTKGRKPASKRDMTSSALEEGNSTVPPNPATLFRPEGIESEAMITGGNHHNGSGHVASTNHRSHGGPPYSNSENEGEADSVESQRSDKMIINVKKDWKVTHYEEEK